MHRTLIIIGICALYLVGTADTVLGVSWGNRESEKTEQHETTEFMESQHRSLGFFINGARESKTISGNPAVSVEATVRRSWRYRSSRRDRRNPREFYRDDSPSGDEAEENQRLRRRYYTSNLFPNPTTASLPKIDRDRDPLARWKRKRVDTIRGTETNATTQAPTASPTATPQNIVDILQERPELGTLTGLLDMAALTDTLRQGGSFTLFAPNDDAFASVPDEMVSLIMSSPDALTNMLLYHVIPGQSLTTADLVNGTLTTVQGDNLTVSFSGEAPGITVMINSANVTEADIVGSNGVIHVINRVLIPDLTVTSAPGTTTAPTSPAATVSPTATNTSPSGSPNTTTPPIPVSADPEDYFLRPGPRVGPRFNNGNDRSSSIANKVVCTGQPQDIAVGIHIEVDRPPRYQFEECSAAQLDGLTTVIETTLNMAFPFAVSSWPGMVRFSRFEFDVDQFTINSLDRRRQMVGSEEQAPRNDSNNHVGIRGHSRYLQEQTSTCPASPSDCPDTVEACLVGCGVARVRDCGDLETWENLNTVLSTSLSALSLPCLGHPNPPVVKVLILSI